MGQTDADLARIMELPASSIANWKRRGSIPEQHHWWFIERLPELIFDSNQVTRSQSSRATLAVVALLLDFRALFDWPGAPAAGEVALALPGMLAMADLLVYMSDPHFERDMDVVAAEVSIELAALMTAFSTRQWKPIQQSPQSESAI